MKTLHDFDEIFDGQKVFRTLLEAMANPGRVLFIAQQSRKLYGDYAPFLALAITLLDNEVTFCSCDNPELQKDIPLLTLAEETSVEEADYIFVSKPEQLSKVFEKAKMGTLADPQKSATILIRTDVAGDRKLTMYGSGIHREITLCVSETVETAVRLRDAQAYEYPQGVDMIFVSENGEILCIPRLVLQKM